MVSHASPIVRNPYAFPDGTAALPGLFVANDSDSGWWSPGANILALSTGGSERLRVDASGNVGVGTTSPNVAGFTAPALTILTSAASAIELISTRADDDDVPVAVIDGRYNTNTVAGDRRIGSMEVVSDGATANDRGGQFKFWVHLNAGSGLTQAFTIRQTRNVHINGSASHATTVGTGVLSMYTGTAPAGTIASGGSLYVASATNVELNYIDSGGNAQQLSTT